MMSPSARLLYYDLCMRADDDGMVESYAVLRLTGATDADLSMLSAREFVSVLD